MSQMFKIVIIGSSSAGKSSILQAFFTKRGCCSNVSTIGVDFRIKEIKIKEKVYKFQFWDTAGQDAFLSVTRAYYRGAHGIIFVYDITHGKSFDDILKWMGRCCDELGDKYYSNVSKILIGNKCDKDDGLRVIPKIRGEELAAKYGLTFFETSAQDYINIVPAFDILVKQIIDYNNLSAPVSSSSSVSSSPSSPLYIQSNKIWKWLNTTINSGVERVERRVEFPKIQLNDSKIIKSATPKCLK